MPCDGGAERRLVEPAGVQSPQWRTRSSPLIFAQSAEHGAATDVVEHGQLGACGRIREHLGGLGELPSLLGDLGFEGGVAGGERVEVASVRHRER